MNKIIVTKKSFLEVLSLLSNFKVGSYDVETTGLRPYKGDKIFLATVSVEGHDFCFNFNDRPDHLGNFAPTDTVLSFEDFKELIKVLNGFDILFLHNAKFDMHFTYKHAGMLPRGIYCTKLLARLNYNLLPSYSLANLGKKIGFEKDDTVEKYISKHKLYTNVEVGKKKPRQDKYYDLVPFDIITHYACTDTYVTLKLGTYCLEQINLKSQEQIAQGLPPITNVLEHELRLTYVLFEMEKIGAKIDLDYCRKAYYYEVEKYQEAAEKFFCFTGIEFEDSADCFKKVFTKLGLKAGVTPKGNPSYSADNLPDNAVTELILEYRHHYKRATTYFKNYIDLVDDEGIIHTSLDQSGTKTGRLSALEPNLQNVPKRNEDKTKYPVRAAFVPREGFFFALPDYDQMEYRLLLDVTDEAEIIKNILEKGLDVHQATAEAMNATRTAAKQINFMLLYGGGPKKLAKALGLLLSEAKTLMNRYFMGLKRVSNFSKKIQEKNKSRGYIVNIFGRRLYKDDDRPYTAANHYIQGGCGDICKIAMVKIHDYLKTNALKSRMILQVHDEIILEIAHDEAYILKDINKIMKEAYNYKSLPLTAGMSYSTNNWHDKKEGYYGEVT